jgi:hypothetical protein
MIKPQDAADVIGRRPPDLALPGRHRLSLPDTTAKPLPAATAGRFQRNAAL